MMIRIFLTLLIVAFSAGAAPVGTDFTYQGTLSDGGNPANGDYDFRFRLFDAQSGGSQTGGPVYVDDATVNDGKITLKLDFGSVFDGTALWLEVGVKEGGDPGAYTVLSPLQELTAGPYALHAKTAADAALLDGQSGSYYRAWSSLTGVPPGLGNGDDDTLGDISCAAGQVIKWTGSAWNCADDTGIAYARTYVVSPVGTPIENGDALRAAVMAIPPPPSQEEAVLLRIEPGSYNIGTAYLPVWGYMAVEGAGELLTEITGTVCSSAPNYGTIRAGSPSADLRRMTVRNLCSDNSLYSVGIAFQGADSRLSNVAVRVTDYALRNIAIYNSGNDLRLTHVDILVENGINRSTGILSSGDGLRLFHVEADVSTGSSGSARGIVNSGDRMRLEHVKASGWGGASNCRGIENNTGADFSLVNSYLYASCTGSTDYGFYSENGHGSFENVEVIGDRGIFLYVDDSGYFPFELREVDASARWNGGLYVYEAGGTMVVRVHRSTIRAYQPIINFDSGASVTVGASLLEFEGGNSLVGSVTCAGVYDQNYTFWPDTCPWY